MFRHKTGAILSLSNTEADFNKAKLLLGEERSSRCSVLTEKDVANSICNNSMSCRFIFI